MKSIVRIGDLEFVDGQTRPVFLDDDDRQYVLGDDGEPVYGVWISLDEPIFVSAQDP